MRPGTTVPAVELLLLEDVVPVAKDDDFECVKIGAPSFECRLGAGGGAPQSRGGFADLGEARSIAGDLCAFDLDVPAPFASDLAASVCRLSSFGCFEKDSDSRGMLGSSGAFEPLSGVLCALPSFFDRLEVRLILRMLPMKCRYPWLS